MLTKAQRQSEAAVRACFLLWQKRFQIILYLVRICKTLHAKHLRYCVPTKKGNCFLM